MIGSGAVGGGADRLFGVSAFSEIQSAVREFSVPSDYLLLFLIFCLFLTGDVISWATRGVLTGFVITKQDLGNVPEQSGEVHFRGSSNGTLRFALRDSGSACALANLFLIILPFSKIMHSFFAIPLNILGESDKWMRTRRRSCLDLFAGRLTRAARMYLDNCTRCGVCVEACHVYASSKETRYTAVARAQNMRRLYEKYFKLSGKVAPWMNEAVELDDEWMEKIFETAYTCTGCRRCMTFCPFGIDTQAIQAIAKLMLIGADMEPKVLSMLADVSIMKGTNIEATKETFAEAARRLEAEVWKNGAVRLERKLFLWTSEDANVLYVALAGKHSIIPAAAIMNAAGEKWSLSYFEAVNFGAFVGHPQKTKEIAERIIGEPNDFVSKRS